MHECTRRVYERLVASSDVKLALWVVGFTLCVVDGAALAESAQVALAEGDVGGAVARLREALAVAPNPSTREQLGGLLFFEDDLVGAREELELAFREWRKVGEARAAALVAASLADLHSSGFGNRVVGQGWVSRARRLLAPEGRCVEQGYVELAVIACETHDVERLEQATRFALELADEFGDSELEVRALADSGYALVVRGRVAEGFARLDEAMAALSAGEVRSPATAGKTFCALMSACERTGDVARAEEWTRVVAAKLSQPSGGRSPRVMYAHCRMVYGSVLCAVGRWPEGEAALLDVLGPNGTAYAAHYAEAAVRLASLRLLQGRVDEAAELLRPLEDRPDACEPLGRLHLLAGELDLAEAVARRGLDGIRHDVLHAGKLRSLLVEIELSRNAVDVAARHAEALTELAERAEHPPLLAEADVARGRVAAARLDFGAAADAFEQARAHLEGELRPLLAGTIALELAEVRSAAGSRGAAVDQARGAVAIFDRLGATQLVDRTEAVLRSLGVRARSTGRRPAVALAGLTGREQQVLALLREGLTNPEIGERLFISTKTVEHHVGGVLAKLGVRNRAEAAAVAAAAAPAPKPPSAVS
jgi:DNA-binding CsgD family transcriptional regulator